MRKGGIACNLVTGQEILDDPSGCAEHVACTIETLNLGRPTDVAVIDEIQLLADPSRGWAWSRALLGLRAPRVHLCGDPAAESLVRRLLAPTRDVLEVRRHERLSPLDMDHAPLAGLSRVQPGDCVVAFSRQAVHRAKAEIEESTGLRCTAIYGALPPAVRRESARRFNEGEADVLVATDAVGMGLNLQVRRMVFTAARKFDGKVTRPLAAPEIK